MRASERVDIKILPDKVLKRHIKYHTKALEGLSQAPDTVTNTIKISQHARSLGDIKTELVSLKRVIKRKILYSGA